MLALPNRFDTGHSVEFTLERDGGLG